MSHLLQLVIELTLLTLLLGYKDGANNSFHVSTLSRQQARQKSTNWKSQVSKNVKLITKYNPRLPDLNSLLKKHMPLLYTDLI